MSDQPQQDEDSSKSPLWEADPNSLDKLFEAIDKKLALNLPREITETEIERVVDYYLKGRETFMREIAEGKTPTRRSQNSQMSKLSKEEKAKEALKRLDF